MPIKILNRSLSLEQDQNFCPNLNHLKIFSCTAYVHILKKKKKNSNKFSSQNRQRRLINYKKPRSGIYRIWMKDSKKVKQHRNMFFNKLNSQRTNDKDKDYNNIYKPFAGGNRYTPPPESLHDTVQYKDESQKPPYENESEESPTNKKQHLIEKNIMEDPLHNSNNSDTIILRPATINIHYIRKIKKDLRYSEQITKPTAKAIKTVKASTAYTITHILQRQSLILMTKNHNMTFKQICRKPTIYKKTMYSTDTTLWQQAMKEEYNSLIKNKTWDLVPRPDTRKILKDKWIYKIKKNPQEQPIRYKARWVTKGYKQQYKINYKKIYAAITHSIIIQILLACSTHYEWYAEQMDAITTFLNPSIKKMEVYIELPNNYKRDRFIALLHKTLYDLKQSTNQ